MVDYVRLWDVAYRAAGSGRWTPLRWERVRAYLAERWAAALTGDRLELDW